MIFVTIDRILQIGVMYSLIVVLFLYLAFKVLKRGKAITNRLMGLYYLWMGVTMSLNVFYVALDIPEVIATMANLVGASMMFSQVFLVLFILIIRYSQAEINKLKQAIWIVIAGLLAVGLFLIGMLGHGALCLNTKPLAPNEGNNVPVWEWYYSLYFFLGSGFLMAYIIYNAYIARKGFADATMRKRFTYFLLGMVLFFWLVGANPWANLEASSTFRTIFGLSALVVIPAVFLLYMSLGKEVAK